MCRTRWKSFGRTRYTVLRSRILRNTKNKRSISETDENAVIAFQHLSDVDGEITHYPLSPILESIDVWFTPDKKIDESKRNS